MKYLALIWTIVFLTSCRSGNEKFDYETSIAQTTFKAQIEYLDQTISNYARISDTGNYFYSLNEKLDLETGTLQKKLKRGKTLTSGEQEQFFNNYEGLFGRFPSLDLERFQEIRHLSIRTVSDVDHIRLLIKTNFVAILLNNKLLPFDSWGIMASGNNTIKQGDELELNIASYAFNSRRQNEWFLLNSDIEVGDKLEKHNIKDTLYPDATGVVRFKTKSYKKGLNTLVFLSKLNHPPKDRILSQTVDFFVK